MSPPVSGGELAEETRMRSYPTEARQGGSSANRPEDKQRRAEVAQDPGEPSTSSRANGTQTGRVKPRADVHRDGDWHRAIHVWVAGVDERGDAVPASSAPLARTRTPGRTLRRDGRRAPSRRGNVGQDAARGRGGDQRRRPIRLAPAPRRRSAPTKPSRAFIDRRSRTSFSCVTIVHPECFPPNPAELAALVHFPLETLVPFLAGESSLDRASREHPARRGSP